MKNSAQFIWLDCEMTGLDFETNKILEVAAIVTDKKFSPLHTVHKVLFQPEAELLKMDDWCTKTHNGSGLINKVKESKTTEAETDLILAEMTKEFFKSNRKEDRPVLCGNSIWQDRKFVDKYFPKFSGQLHYRMFDVSTFKILFEVYHNDKFKKQNKHTALEDIEESLLEIKYYLNKLNIKEFL
jgi:oligoribonuclease